MPIPESQLDTWSKRGKYKTAKKTHEHIQETINSDFSRNGRNVDTYLQGSYRNSTNIYGNSDVDIVAEYSSVFYYNIDKLTELEKERFHSANGDASYSWSQFRSDVISALRDKYGLLVDDSAKRCVKVEGGTNRWDADVVVAFQYRVYSEFHSQIDCRYDAGIRFQDRGNLDWIVNYPKQHRENGSDKNRLSRTKQNYKPTVRMFKNARDKLIGDGYIDSKLAPSYFVECLLYNVPDSCFLGTYREKYIQVLEWLEKQVEDDTLDDFCCQHGLDNLFGFSFVQWSDYKAMTFIQQLRNLWVNW